MIVSISSFIFGAVVGAAISLIITAIVMSNPSSFLVFKANRVRSREFNKRVAQMVADGREVYRAEDVIRVEMAKEAIAAAEERERAAREVDKELRLPRRA